MGDNNTTDDASSSERSTSTRAEEATKFLTVQVVKQRAFLTSAVLILLSVAGCTAFVVSGLNQARAVAEETFERRAIELVQLIESTWRDYEYATLSAHNYCRRTRNTSREEFRDFYLYLLGGGLKFESVQCSPNVTHAQRPVLEENARAFYSQYYPTIDYQGIIGFIPDPNSTNPNDLIVVPSPDLHFYFTVHYLEPVLPNAAAIELDMYSYPSQKNEIDLAVQSRQPVLSKRLNVVQETEEFAWSVIVYHPGIELPEDTVNGTLVEPDVLSLILVRIPSLLERVALVQEENLAVYLYDTTPLNTNGIAEALGAGSFHVTASATGETIRTLDLIPDIDYDAFVAEYDRDDKLYFEETIPITPSGTWQVAVVPIDDTYEPQTIYIYFGGFMILAAGVCLSLWYVTAVRRDAIMNDLRVAAESEKSHLIVANAQQAALAERELNDFLAHEVRNPLSAAISACSFVSSALAEEPPLATEAAKTSVREDVGVIGSSLSYVNDLLRTMLDMHKANSDQMKISMTPTALLHDIMEPVATMLYQKDGTFKVEIDCPDHLVVMTDRIRLKQIILNLANNACKFVTKGYVRIGARVLENNNLVQVFVEDSGPGVPAEKHDSLFDKFQPSLDNLNQGTGIGLSLCKDLTVLMGGDIWLDTKFDSGLEGYRGACINVDLRQQPLDISAEDERHKSHFSEGGEGIDLGFISTGTILQQELPKDYNIMFVDDDMILRKLFMRSIKRVAPTWNVREATNGETALRYVEENKEDEFDFIFLDQYMSSIQKQMTGTETARRLRATGFNGRICGLSANEMEDAFLAAGANAFMMKPFPCDQEPLKKELCRVIYRSGKAIVAGTGNAPDTNAGVDGESNDDAHAQALEGNPESAP